VLKNVEIGQRCSEMTRELNIDSGGTGLRADLFLAVDVPLPWPKPVFSHQLLIGVTELLDSYSTPIRLLASVPENNNRLTVTSYQRKQRGHLDESSLRRSQTTFRPSDLLDVLKGILDEKKAEDSIEVPQEEQVRELWVCTQGSHDVCCGSEGTALSLEANKNLHGVKVRRVSHLGGHRFAPTAVTFPDGRMWSHLSMENVHEIFDVKPIEESLLKKCRGWSGAEAGPEQIAEREGLTLYGWNWDKYQRKTAVISEKDLEIKVLVTGFPPGDQAEVKFEVIINNSGKTPIFSCDKAGDIPTKWQTQYEVKTVDVQ
tara:strand:+ start:425 stop:1369 length:945 start_codon:yes stop_codon:yes gene_type:complete